MHDPANLDLILNVVTVGIVVWLAVAVGGGIYLLGKYLPRLARLVKP